MKNQKIKWLSVLSFAVFLIFLVLKEFHTTPVANWSWLWVFGPFWLPMAAALVFVALCQIIVDLLKIILFISDRKKKKVNRK